MYPQNHLTAIFSSKCQSPWSFASTLALSPSITIMEGQIEGFPAREHFSTYYKNIIGKLDESLFPLQWTSVLCPWIMICRRQSKTVKTVYLNLSAIMNVCTHFKVTHYAITLYWLVYCVKLKRERHISCGGLGEGVGW